MLDAGASSYVLKATASEDLLRAIGAVMDDKTYLSPDVAGSMVSQYVDRLDGAVATSPLGTRECEILQLVAEGKKSRQIADELPLSVNTVETHRKDILRKLELHTIADLVKFVMRHGITTPFEHQVTQINGVFLAKSPKNVVTKRRGRPYNPRCWWAVICQGIYSVEI